MQLPDQPETRERCLNEFGLTYAETVFCICAVRELNPKTVNEVIESIIKFDTYDPPNEDIPEKLQSMSTGEIEKLWEKINVYEEVRKSEELQYTDDLMNRSGLMPQGLPYYCYLPAGSYNYVDVAGK